MQNETASMFTGVNAGYQGDNVDIKDPAEAVRIVNGKLSEAGKTGYTAHPGVVVYHEGWGCPAKGEVVAAVVTDGDPKAAIETGNYLRGALNQSTLSVGTYAGDQGTKALGFTIEVPNAKVAELAPLWQEAAHNAGGFLYQITNGKWGDDQVVYDTLPAQGTFAESKASAEKKAGELGLTEFSINSFPTKPYPSVGMYETSNGSVIVQAEANPTFIPADKLGDWRQNVEAAVAEVAAKSGKPLAPQFREAGFTYLEKPKEVAPPITEVAEGPAKVVDDKGASKSNDLSVA